MSILKRTSKRKKPYFPVFTQAVDQPVEAAIMVSGKRHDVVRYLHDVATAIDLGQYAGQTGDGHHCVGRFIAGPRLNIDIRSR